MYLTWLVIYSGLIIGLLFNKYIPEEKIFVKKYLIALKITLTAAISACLLLSSLKLWPIILAIIALFMWKHGNIYISYASLGIAIGISDPKYLLAISTISFVIGILSGYYIEFKIKKIILTFLVFIITSSLAVFLLNKQFDLLLLLR